MNIKHGETFEKGFKKKCKNFKEANCFVKLIISILFIIAFPFMFILFIIAFPFMLEWVVLLIHDDFLTNNKFKSFLIYSSWRKKNKKRSKDKNSILKFTC